MPKQTQFHVGDRVKIRSRDRDKFGAIEQLGHRSNYRGTEVHDPRYLIDLDEPGYAYAYPDQLEAIGDAADRSKDDPFATMTVFARPA